MIHILAVGKRHDALLAAAIERYHKRLRAPFNDEWLLLPAASVEGSLGRLDESQRLISKLRPDDYVVLLDERGVLLDNAALASVLSAPLQRAGRLLLVIGGAYGVDDSLRRRADLVWSLSPLVLPHQLVRLVLVEQLYRSQSLLGGHPYHHN